MSLQPFFTISLDFELLWGVFPEKLIKNYGQNILGGRKSIPLMLELFKKYNIHATWATVGMASFESKKELLNYLPDTKPDYKNKHLDPYRHLSCVGTNERDDPYHFGYSLIQQIIDTDGMEIASHTFSHFYCLEKHDDGAFIADLESASQAFNRLDLKPESIIFCRNQYSDYHLQIAKNVGFKAFRGNENHFLYRPRDKHNFVVRGLRLLDNYVNIAGNQVSSLTLTNCGLYNIPSSRFLRPWIQNISLEKLRLNRIKNSMLTAAKQGKGFHLWWHPHNFGKNVRENLHVLCEVLEFYNKLKVEYGMASLTMSEVRERSL